MAHHPMWPGRGAVAQLGERRLCKAEVGSSILPGSTTRTCGPRRSGFRDRRAPGALAGGEAGQRTFTTEERWNCERVRRASPRGWAPEPGEIQCVRALIEVKLPRRTVDA